jgi:hypothetical protein
MSGLRVQAWNGTQFSGSDDLIGVVSCCEPNRADEMDRSAQPICLPISLSVDRDHPPK